MIESIKDSIKVIAQITEIIVTCFMAIFLFAVVLSQIGVL